MGCALRVDGAERLAPDLKNDFHRRVYTFYSNLNISLFPYERMLQNNYQTIPIPTRVLCVSLRIHYRLGTDQKSKFPCTVIILCADILESCDGHLFRSTELFVWNFEKIKTVTVKYNLSLRGLVRF